MCAVIVLNPLPQPARAFLTQLTPPRLALPLPPPRYRLHAPREINRLALSREGESRCNALRPCLARWVSMREGAAASLPREIVPPALFDQWCVCLWLCVWVCKRACGSNGEDAYVKGLLYKYVH